MKIGYFVLSILTFLTLSSDAKTIYYIRAGGNFITFREEKTYLKLGSSLAIGSQKNYSNSRGWLGNNGWALEIGYTNKRALLKNKTIGGGLGFDYIVPHEDIYCSVALLETSFLFMYNYPLSKKIKLQFHIGPAISLAIKDQTSVDRKRVDFLEPNQRENYPFDYNINPGDPTILSSGGTLLNLGAGLSFSSFSFDIRLSPALDYEFVTLNAIDLKETPDTIHFFLTYEF